ncbi:MAG: hypothetical protein HGB05_06780, partial [Chloroflexi bacterium]|nr:hypothetical protein [Chloroflexota bacterium]
LLSVLEAVRAPRSWPVVAATAAAAAGIATKLNVYFVVGTLLAYALACSIVRPTWRASARLAVARVPFNPLARTGEDALWAYRGNYVPDQGWETTGMGDAITPELQAQTKAAVRRFCTAKIEDNRLTIRLSRVRSAIGLALVTIISVAVIIAALILFNTIFAAASDTVGVVVAASISVFVWVILWDPMEKLIFDWVTPAMENRNLRGIMDMDLVIEPWR